MAQPPVITSVLALPGLCTLPRNHSGISLETILVGIGFGENRIAWGDCVPSPEHAPFFQAEAGRQTIQTTVLPALQGQPLTSFRRLVATVEALTETSTLSEPLPEPPDTTGKVSRRALFAGLLQPPVEASSKPRTREVTVERPIPAAICYGVSQALLAGVAMARGITEVEVIAEEYGLPLWQTAVPFHVELSDLPVVHTIRYRVASLGYTISGQDDETELGRNGEILQRAIRELKGQVTAIAPIDYQPVLCVDVQEGLGRLFENDTGKILGALYGLEAAAKPYLLRVANVVMTSDQPGQYIQLFSQLKEYARLRRMEVQLVAAAGVKSLDDVHAFSQANAVDMIRLNLAHSGSLHHTIEMVLACRQQGVGVWLEGSSPGMTQASRLAAHIAQATQPDLLTVDSAGNGAGIVQFHNEMTRIQAALGRARFQA